MLAVEDVLDALNWADSQGGLQGLIARSESNLSAIEGWLEKASWIDFLARDANTRSCTSVCLTICDPWFLDLEASARTAVAKRVAALLEAEGAAYDVGAYRDAPPGLRIWAGATVETGDLAALLPWLDWAYEITRSEMIQGAPVKAV
jgi:phosphoserine aminotransferase